MSSFHYAHFLWGAFCFGVCYAPPVNQEPEKPKLTSTSAGEVSVPDPRAEKRKRCGDRASGGGGGSGGVGGGGGGGEGG